VSYGLDKKIREVNDKYVNESDEIRKNLLDEVYRNKEKEKKEELNVKGVMSTLDDCRFNLVYDE